MLSLEDTEDVEMGANMQEYISMFGQKEIRGFMAKLSDCKKQIIPIEETSMPSSATYEEFVKSLPQDTSVIAPAYLDSGERIFITWCPEGDKDTRGAMILNVTKYQVRRGCNPQLNVNATTLEEVDQQELQEQIGEGRPPTAAISGIFQEEDYCGV